MDSRAWTKAEHKLPEEGKVCAVWRKKIRRFCTAFIAKDVKATYKRAIMPICWRCTSGNAHEIHPNDYWIELPELIVQEKLTNHLPKLTKINENQSS